MFVDKLISSINAKSNSCVVGLDPTIEMIPEYILNKHITTSSTNKELANAFWEFNKGIIDAIYDLTPAIKVQIAFYERLGLEGLEVFYKTLSYGKEKGLITIADIKRGDIGSTATAYAQAYLRNSDIDSITVNPYFGSDGLKPFIKEAMDYNKGLFILVKTSNPSSAEIQDLRTDTGFVYEKVAELVASLEDNPEGFSNIGSVIGGTHPDHIKNLRKKLKGFILVPGYGAQGAKAEDICQGFDQHGLGALICSSRGITSAYKKHGVENGSNYQKYARKALIQMIEDIKTHIK